MLRDSKLDGTNLAVRIKTMRGRGGGVENVLYQNLTGSVLAGIQLTLNYHPDTPPTNSSATPEMRNITLRNIDVSIKSGSSWLDCEGLPDSTIHGIVFDNVRVEGHGKETCKLCSIEVDSQSKPKPRCAHGVVAPFV